MKSRMSQRWEEGRVGEEIWEEMKLRKRDETLGLEI